MFDLHYDLLTQIYINSKRPRYLKRIIKKIYNKKNICGGIFNLFYMSPDEMKYELNIAENEINIINNIKYVKKIIQEYNLIPKETKYIFGIEGLDYLNTIGDIDELYKLGVRSVNIVWNNDNKFGGGARGDKNRGLTKEGEELVEKLVCSKIAIDLSHSNEKTFYEIVKKCRELKNNGLDPIVFASHSNSKNICDVDRNLSDEQIRMIKEFDGVIGVVSIKDFCFKNLNVSNKEYKKKYLEHIEHIERVLNGVDNICVSTDDMSYYTVEKRKYIHMNIFNMQKVGKQLVKIFKGNGYDNFKIDAILKKNFEDKIIKRLNDI